MLFDPPEGHGKISQVVQSRKSMKKQKKKILVILFVVVTALVLAMVLALFLPHFINIQDLKRRIVTQTSKSLKGKVDFQNLDITFFPSVKAVIHSANIEIPSRLEATVETLKVGIKIFPLLRGSLKPSFVAADGVKGWLYLQGGSATQSPFSLDKKKIKSVLASLATQIPGLKFSLRNGNLVIFQSDAKKKLSFSDVTADISFPGRKLKFSLAFKSSAISNLKVRGWLDPDRFSGKLDAQINGFHVSKIFPWLHLTSFVRPRRALAYLTLSAEMKGVDEVTARLSGSVPKLSFEGAKHLPSIAWRSFDVTYLKKRGRVRVALNDVRFMEYPEARISGIFTKDEVQKTVSLSLKASSLDISSAKKVALFLTKNNRTVRKIFAIIGSGYVSSITFDSQGDNVHALGKLKNVLVRGRVEKGIVAIPKTRLVVKNVSGRVVVSHGFLYATNLSGEAHNARVVSGRFKVGLSGKGPKPMHLETVIYADLPQVPVVLRNVLDKQVILNELKRFRGINGYAFGKLVLGETTRVEKVRIEVNDAKLSCRYDRVPLAVNVDSAKLYYSDSRVEVKELVGNLGKSHIAELSGSLDWKERNPYVKISSLSGRLQCDELYPWISSYKRVKNALTDLSSLKGTMVVDSLELEGPLLNPEAWKFKFTGNLEGMTVDLCLFPEPLTLGSGKITMTPRVLSFQNCFARMMDASSHVSGKLYDYVLGVDRMELSIGGQFGKKTTQWVYELIHLPQKYRVKAPVSVKNGSLAWERDGEVNFSAQIDADRVSLAVDLEKLPNSLFLKKVDIVGKGASAHIELVSRQEVVSLRFDGNLNKDILDSVLETNSYFKGPIRGHFSATFIRSNIGSLKCTGNLVLKGFSWLWKGRIPVFVNEATLEAAGGTIRIRSSSILLKDMPVDITGEVKEEESHLHANLDVFSKFLDVGEVKEFLVGKTKGEERGSKEWNLPLRGKLKLSILSLFYGGYTWSPVKANLYVYSNQAKILIEKALLCGINTPGTLSLSPDGIVLHLNPQTRENDLNATILCAFHKEHMAEATFEISGHLSAKGKTNPLVEDSQGEFTFETGKGRIFRFSLLARIFAVLNFTEILRARVPDLTKEGFGYSKISIRSELRNGVLYIKEGIIKGNSMGLFGNGKLDFVNRKINLAVLVAPFKTLDTVVSNIPVVGRILTGKDKSLISIPVNVTGDLTNPKVTPGSPTAVAPGLLGIVKRVIETPIKLIAPKSVRKPPDVQ